MNMHNLNIYVYVYVRRSPQLEGGIKREEEEAEEFVPGDTYRK
jgi:hypothetical protein